MRKYYWYTTAFIRKHGVIVLGSVVGAVLFFTLASPFLAKIFELKQKQYIGVVGNYSLTSLPRSIKSEISNGLTQIQEDGTPVPALAERWTSEDDSKVYRFVIRQNLTWQDGKPFTPEDVSYQFRDVQKIVTANEVVFRLQNQFVPFPTVVSQPLLRIENERYGLIFKRKKIIGTGQYQVIDYKERADRLTELVITGPKDQKTYRFYLTEDDAVAGFKRGEIDILPDLSDLRDFPNWPTVEIQQHLDLQSYLAVFFDRNFSFFALNQVRQALNYALVKPADDTQAVGPISPNSWAFARVGKIYDFDLDRAVERLLSVVNEMNQPLTFDLTTLPVYSQEAETIKQNWEAMGAAAVTSCQQAKEIKDKTNCPNLKIQVNLRKTNFPDTTNFQALLIGQISPSDPDQYNLWHSKQQTNFTHYENIRIDALLEKGRQTEDRKKRFEIYQDFQQFFSDDAPVIFIRHLNKYTIRRRGH